MSVSVVNGKSVELTEKFEKEVLEFMAWVSGNYSVMDGDDEKSWGMKLCGNRYDEPSRNKLLSLLKCISDQYSVMKGSVEVKELKVITDEWKEYKESKKVRRSPKKSSVESKSSESKSESKIVKSSDELKKVKKIKNTDGDVVVVDMSLDSSDYTEIDSVVLGYDGALKYSTSELESVFGPAEKCDNTDDDSWWSHEYRVKVGDSEFSINNWEQSDEMYSEHTWYLCGINESESSILNLLRFIEDKKVIDSEVKPVKKVKKPSEEVKKPVKKPVVEESDEEVKQVKKSVKKQVVEESEVKQVKKPVVKKSVKKQVKKPIEESSEEDEGPVKKQVKKQVKKPVEESDSDEEVKKPVSVAEMFEDDSDIDEDIQLSDKVVSKLKMCDLDSSDDEE